MRLIISFIAILFLTVLPSSAESLLKAPAGANPGAAMHNNAGVASYNSGDSTGAMRHFKEALEIDPNFAEANFNLAIVYHTGGNHGNATKHFAAAKKHGSKNSAIAGSELLNGHVK